MNIVAVILARGGSKRLPGKNIRILGDKPLIAHTIEAARNAASLTRVILSTDDPDIARVAEQLGIEVPFLRPAVLARDESQPLDALVHAIDWLERGGTRVDAAALLQPTSPLRQSRHIDEAAALLHSSGVDTVTAVCKSKAHPYWCWKPQGADIEPYFPDHICDPSHTLPPALIETGALYLIRRDVLDTGSLYGNRVAGYVMDPLDAVDIDTEDDFAYAEFLLSRRGMQNAPKL